MPLHIQVDESSQDDEIEVNPVYVRELSHEIPSRRRVAVFRAIAIIPPLSQLQARVPHGYVLVGSKGQHRRNCQ